MSNYTTATMLRVLDALDRPQMFLLETFFPDVIQFDTETVDMDKLDRAMGLAPFVSPLIPGQPIEARGYSTDKLTPAYIKAKQELDVNRPFRRRPGERYGGDMSPAARRDAHLADLLDQQRRMIMRRKEWMASAALRTGAITVTGEGFPSQTVSFGRAAGLTKALLTTARWGESGVEPLDNIEAWADEVAVASGAMPTTVVLDPKAWALLRASARLEKLLDQRYQRTFSIEGGPLARGENQWATYVGSAGAFDFWVYSQPYTDEAGNAANFMPDHTVILAAPGADNGVGGYQAHGAIKDPRAGYQPFEVYPKTWIEDDPAMEWVMSQSAPLVIPARPNASLCATVR